MKKLCIVFIVILIAFSLSGCTTSSIVRAACRGDSSTVSKLLDEGANINEVSAGYSPLSCAVHKEKNEIVKLLLSSRANPDNPDGRYSPLMYAAESGNIEIAQELIKSGAKVNFTSYNGLSPLGMAAMKGNIAMVNQLLAAGADIEAALISLDLYTKFYDRHWADLEANVGKNLLTRLADKKKN